MLCRRDFLALAGSATIAAAMPPATALAQDVRTGGSRMIPIPGGFNVWTKSVGNAPTKTLLLDGGHGFRHDYLECFEDFLPQAGIEFYYYDQLGCGNSDHPNEDGLWTVARYTDEV